MNTKWSIQAMKLQNYYWHTNYQKGFKPEILNCYINNTQEKIEKDRQNLKPSGRHKSSDRQAEVIRQTSDRQTEVIRQPEIIRQTNLSH